MIINDTSKKINVLGSYKYLLEFITFNIPKFEYFTTVIPILFMA